MTNAAFKSFNTPDEQQEVDRASVAVVNMPGGPVERSTLEPRSSSLPAPQPQHGRNAALWRAR